MEKPIQIEYRRLMFATRTSSDIVGQGLEGVQGYLISVWSFIADRASGLVYTLVVVQDITKVHHEVAHVCHINMNIFPLQ